MSAGVSDTDNLPLLRFLQPLVSASGAAGQGGQLFCSTQDNVTAEAGGGQYVYGEGIALELNAIFTRVTTVASAGDSLTLPPSRQGHVFWITNAAASNSMNVFRNKGEAINALGANNAFAVAAERRRYSSATRQGSGPQS
jgi:hypothetical protein